MTTNPDEMIMIKISITRDDSTVARTVVQCSVASKEEAAGKS
jgi:hypothetical protein